jgi:hypothetical protein
MLTGVTRRSGQIHELVHISISHTWVCQQEFCKKSEKKPDIGAYFAPQNARLTPQAGQVDVCHFFM